MTIAHTLAAATAEPNSQRRLPRRVGAVFAGLLAIFVASTAIDLVFHALGVFPPLGSPPMSHGLFALALAYRLLIQVAGCWLTARIAPDRPMRHALVLGGIGLCLSIAGAIAMWDAGPGWYPVALAASSLPCAWAGGRLATRRV